MPSPRNTDGDSDLSFLDGVVVADLLPLPYAMTGRILADLGATVFHLDDGPDSGPSRWDPRWCEGARTWHPPPVGDGEAEALLGAARVVLRLDGDEAERRARPAGQAVHVVLSGFGNTGPRTGWLVSDLGVAAASGNLWATGNPDRPPVRCGAPLALIHTGPEAAWAAVTALAGEVTGRVDVSMAEAYSVACLGQPLRGFAGDRGRRLGAAIGPTKEIWPCVDGWVSFGLRGGPARQPSLERLAALAHARGDDRLVGIDWTTYSPQRADAELLTTVGDAFGSLFASLTVAELEQLATEEQVLVAPILDAPAITASASLRSRQFFDDRTGAAAVPRSFGAARTRGGPWRWLGASLVRESDRPLNAPTPQGPPGGGPWRGTRLVEFGSGVAGPLVGRYFAEQGATVIRVESTARPDFLRLYALGPDNPHGLEGSALFSWTNPGKLGVTLDLKSEAARELALGLVAQAHGVIENFTPGVLERLGLGYDDLCGVRADVVLLSMSFHGQSGPRRAESGFGALGSALSGFNHLTGWADGEPVGPASTITDSLAPRFGAAALGAALVRQRHGGAGVHLDLGQLETAIFSLSPWLTWCAGGREWVREGNACPGAVPHGLYPCVGDDRWVAVAVWTDDEWRALRTELGWVGPPLHSLEDRRHAVEAVDRAIGSWTSTLTADEVADRLQRVGVEAVPVADYVDLVSDPTLLARGHFVELLHDVLGPVMAERSGSRFSDDRGGYEGAAPSLGRDNLAVLGTLGLDAADLERLSRDGVVR